MRKSRTASPRDKSAKGAATEFGGERYLAMPVKFTFTNEEWALHHLPIVRLATVLCSQGWRKGDRAAEHMLAEPQLYFDLLDHFTETAEHLEALTALIKAGRARLLISGRRVAPGLGVGADGDSAG